MHVLTGYCSWIFTSAWKWILGLHNFCVYWLLDHILLHLRVRSWILRGTSFGNVILSYQWGAEGTCWWAIILVFCYVKLSLKRSLNFTWFIWQWLHLVDAFETFFGTSVRVFASGDTTGFGGRRATTVVKGEDIRLATWLVLLF